VNSIQDLFNIKRESEINRDETVLEYSLREDRAESVGIDEKFLDCTRVNGTSQILGTALEPLSWSSCIFKEFRKELNERKSDATDCRMLWIDMIYPAKAVCSIMNMPNLHLEMHFDCSNNLTIPFYASIHKNSDICTNWVTAYTSSGKDENGALKLSSMRSGVDALIKKSWWVDPVDAKHFQRYNVARKLVTVLLFSLVRNEIVKGDEVYGTCVQGQFL
jgi:hypothetical protein